MRGKKEEGLESQRHRILSLLFPTRVMPFTPLVISDEMEESERKSIQIMKLATKRQDVKALEKEMEKTRWRATPTKTICSTKKLLSRHYGSS